MRNNIFKMFAIVACAMMSVSAYAVPFEDEMDIEIEESAAAVADYEVEGSLFQQITELEQEKVLMQLEKERAQLNLELDRLAAEKIKLHMEIDTLSGRAEAQQQELETERAKLEAEAARLAREKENLLSGEDSARTRAPKQAVVEEPADGIADNYRLVNVFGVGNQLQATVQDVVTGQSKRLSVGKTLDGFTVEAISLDDGIVFSRGDEVQTLNIGGDY